MRRLLAADQALLEAFLLSHSDSSMFLRENLERGDLAEACYVAAFRDGELVAVVAHSLGGFVLLQAPEHASELVRACVGESGRAVKGLCGRPEQVREARRALGLDGAQTRLEGDEQLYTLPLSELVVSAAPVSWKNSAIECRRPAERERDTLRRWRRSYDVEVLGGSDSPEERAHSEAVIDAQIAAGKAWIALVDAVPVALSAVNAALPDAVQLGGIYTPPEFRGRGFARAAIAASLFAARERGVSRAVLFTSNPSAVRTYEALGFRRSGDYSLLIFR